MRKTIIFPLSVWTAVLATLAPTAAWAQPTGASPAQSARPAPSLAPGQTPPPAPTPGVMAAPDPDQDLKDKKPVHEQELLQIEADRRAFQRALSIREEECLARFFSSGCIEKIRIDYMTTMREFDLSREEELQALRDIDAEIRKRVRARRVQELENRSVRETPMRQEAPNQDALPKKDSAGR